MVSFSRRIASLALLAALGLAVPAAADEMEAPETPVQPAAEAQPPEPGSQPAQEVRTVLSPTASDRSDTWNGRPGEEAIEDWSDRTPWGYGTDYLLPLTRGMEDAGVPLWGRVPLYLVTVPYDLAQLVPGAIGGLWGD